MFKPTNLSSARKRQIAGATLLVVAVVLGASAVVLHEQDTLDVDAQIVDSADPTKVHRATVLEVTVENREDHAIDPAFQTSHEELNTHFYWSVVEGPQKLQPGENATYRIEAPTPEAGIPPQMPAQLAINEQDRDVQMRVTFELPASEPPAILNPSLRHRKASQQLESYRPYRWRGSLSDHGSERTTVTQTNHTVRVAVSNVTRSTGPYAMAGIRQRATFPATLHVEATPHTVVQSVEKRPPRAAGVEVGSKEKRVWVVFANVTDRQVVYRSGDLSYITVYVPAEPGERVETTVDVQQLYDRYNWQVPSKQLWVLDGNQYVRRPAYVLAFAAVYPGNDQHRAAIEFHEISGTALAEQQANETATANATSKTALGTNESIGSQAP